MKKTEMIDLLSKKTGLSKKDSEIAIRETFDIIKTQLMSGNNVSIHGFGVFKISNRKAREGIVPSTGEKIHIPETKVVSFKASSDLKSKVNIL